LYVVIWIFVNFTNKQKLCLWLGILLLQKSAKRNLNYEFLPVQCSRYNLQVPFQFPTFWPLLNRFCLAGKSIIGEFGLKELTKDEDLANATCKINVRSGHISSVLKTYAVSSSLRSFHSPRPPPPVPLFINWKCDFSYSPEKIRFKEAVGNKPFLISRWFSITKFNDIGKVSRTYILNIQYNSHFTVLISSNSM
jgi:hypothetical protein